MSVTSEDPNDITTDAFPSPPRDEVQNERTTNGQDNVDNTSRKHSTGSNSSNRKNQRCSESDDSDNSNSSRNLAGSSSGRRFSTKSFGGLPSPNAYASVINISNSSGIQIGSNFKYILKNSDDKHRKKKTQHFSKTDKIKSLLVSQELVTKDDIQFIAAHMNEMWMETARELDYSDGQISQFHLDYINNGVKEVIYQFLLDWIQNNADDATVGKLTKALWQTGQKECVSRWSLK